MTDHLKSSFDSIESAIQDIAEGKLVIVTDDENRENEGDLVIAAEKATPETINTMIQHARGLICVPTTNFQLQRLGISPMVQDNRESHKTDFTVTVDAAEGISTGISAYDRCRTIRLLANSDTRPEELVQPGHIFPLRAKPGGVLERAGHTEAAIDLAILAGLNPSGAICEILNEDGTMARLPQLLEFRDRFNLKLISIADLIQFRYEREKLVERIARQPFSSDYGAFELHVFRNILNDRKHLALTMGTLDERPTLVRVHSENLLGDIFHSSAISSHHSLDAALKRIAKEKHGVVLYMEQADGGLHFTKSGETELGEVAEAKMDFRDYGIGAQILAELGLKNIRLLSSTSRHVVALDGYGLKIVDQIAL
ncbi:MAG: 3,4-dihydroxy-2-butanone-4-phosphate synthase [Opitutaceae bacterium]|nr:3,4-dihydroxy-2-butanone-4-phosphate synthase [Opitutaceae bacterium]